MPSAAIGLSSREAIYQACLKRFRPIMMTTMAAMLGALPLAIGFGEGSELRRPLGISIVGGLLVSQAADPLHDAGHLSLSRPLPSVGRSAAGEFAIRALLPDTSPNRGNKTPHPI